MSSAVDLRDNMHEGESAGCGSCAGSCVGSVLAYMALGILCQHLAGSKVGLQIILAYLLGMLLGKFTSQIWQGEFRRPSTARAGLIITAIPVLLVCALTGIVEGAETYLEVMERSAPGWGRADIANYVYPPVTAYLHGVLLLVLAMGWLMTSLGAYRRQARGDRM